MGSVDSNHAAQVVVDSVRRNDISFRGKPLTERDFLLFREALAVQTALLFDVTSLHSDAWRRWSSFWKGPIDVQRLSDTLKEAEILLRTSVSRHSSNLDGSVRDVTGFKRRLRHKGLYWSFMSPMEGALSDWFINQSNHAFRSLTQWVAFLSHLRLRDLGLQEELINEYMRLEEEEREWRYSNDDVSELNGVFRQWLEGLSFEDAIPANGPGATAETQRRQNRFWKYASFRTDMLLEYYLKRCYPTGERYLPHTERLNSGLSRTSVLVCVPKSMTKERTISKEPSILQYYQHAAWSRLNEWFLQSPILSDRIDLSRQDLSRDLARKGSIDGSYATIDLSSASDTVTRQLIMLTLRGTPLLLPEICLRSRYTRLPNKQTVQLAKLAPMGSDLCFPTECLIFAGVCEVVVRRITGRTSRCNDYRVYGDDIVVRQEFAEGVVDLLEHLHFSVNSRKTFLDRDIQNFREACGGEYVDGIDVTPVRVSRRWSLGISSHGRLCVSSVEECSSWVELANNLLHWGGHSARRWVLTRLWAIDPRYRQLMFVPESSRRWSYWQRREEGALPPSSVAIETPQWCCTNFRLQSRSEAAAGRPWVWEYYALTSCTTAISSPAGTPSLDAERCRWVEYWKRMRVSERRSEMGILYAYDEIPAFDLLCLKWQKKWVTV